ncbi:thioredoxin family protein [Leuconostoc mesenteroides]|uniref:thioredoxin family protein n=1 Tax=Leuconostoc mesenteroides TaxID=1245 RepID=UPI000B9D6228|nr:thioredoxin family protein [Leuconostoc mesenteroides]BAX72849.1 thiol-disulfide isomerase and thioredoxin [Leuconostoc mesenteroides]
MQKDKKIIGMSLIGILILVVVAIGGYFAYEQHTNGYPDTNNFTEKVANLSDKPKQETVLVFHKPGCARCQAARPTILKLMKMHPNRHYIVINVKKEGASDLIAKYGITHFPTVILLKGNRVVSSTDSTNRKLIEKVIMGA